MRRRAAVGAFVLACAAVVLALGVLRVRRDRPACGDGFVRRGSRCCPPSLQGPAGCGPASSCPPPLVFEGGDCARPRMRRPVPATHLVLGASDWEAEGRVPAREVDVAPFSIDALEMTRGEIDPGGPDRARAANRVTREEAEEHCRARGGRLPTDDEWTAAAGGRRYPWGDTGALCRRGAWGLSAGPCAEDPSAGPDTVGSHPDGATAGGIFDLAGNVAEWVAADPSDPDRGVVRGGSWRSRSAADLRTWARETVRPDAREDWIGFRCAYDGIP